MALVLEQTLAGDGNGEETAEASDDEKYIYVSRLAEQIASDAMLQDEDDVMDFPSAPRARFSHESYRVLAEQKTYEKVCPERRLKHYAVLPVSHCKAGWPLLETEYYDLAVSPLAVSSWNYGSSEWNHFQSRNFSPFDLKLVSERQARIIPVVYFDRLNEIRKECDLCRHNCRSAAFHSAASPHTIFHRQIAASPLPAGTLFGRKECTGTGVFFPKVLSSSFRSGRSSGLYNNADTTRSRG